MTVGAVMGDVMPSSGETTPSPLIDTSKPEMIDIFATDELVPVALPGTTFTVMLKRELDWGEQAELEAAALRGVQRQDLEAAASGTQTLVLDISKQRMLSLALRIRKWNVRRKDPETQGWIPVPLPTHIQDRMIVMRALRPKWARTLLDKIEELDKENTGAEPEMPMLMTPDPDKQAPPKATQSGDTGEQTEMSPSASIWDGLTES